LRCWSFVLLGRAQECATWYRCRVNDMTLSNSASVVVHAFVGWALCAAMMGTGMATASLQNALVIHAIAAPIIFSAVSLSYFRRAGSCSPLTGAIAFVGFVIAMDLFIVALVVNQSLEMFRSLLGTWIPFGLIFASTYVTGLARAHCSHVSASRSAAQPDEPVDH
jgi:hypothetical protein